MVVTQLRMCHGLLIIHEALSLPFPASMQDYIFPVAVYFTWLFIKPLQNKYARLESYKQKKTRELKVTYKKAKQGDLAAQIMHP